MASSQPLPRQVPFIIGNEACERFSFYGMRNILTVFLIDYLLTNSVPDQATREGLAKAHFHDFVVGVYFFPLIGGYLSDRFLGKYKTILYLSLVYCVGHLLLAIGDTNATTFYGGLFLIALGSGGIKPCASAMVGDQFDESNKHRAKTVFAAFYWSVNFGSFFASLFIPKLLKIYGPSVAFGLPGVLMLIATVIFWAGRKWYVVVPPTGPNPDSFWAILWSARKGGLEGAKSKHPAGAVDAVRAVLKVLVVFIPIPVFWALFDQKASTWVVQAKSMDPHVFGLVFEPSQMQFINPLLVMLLIPLLTQVIYPAMSKSGLEPAPLRRMVAGMGIAALSWVAAGLVQKRLDDGTALNILWQLGPYALLTTAEVLVSTTGLEFAYSQAPAGMKGTLMSFFLLTNAVGNLFVARASTMLTLRGAPLFFFYAACAAGATVLLAFIAKRYVVVDHYRPVAAGPPA